MTFDGSDDQITLNLDPRSPATLAFADGSVLEVAPEDPASVLRSRYHAIEIAVQQYDH